MKKYSEKYKKEIIDICKTAKTFTEVEARMGISSPSSSLRRYIRKNNISMPMYEGRKK